MVSEEFLKILHIITYKEAYDSPSGHVQVGPQGQGWHGSKHCYIHTLWAS